VKTALRPSGPALLTASGALTAIVSAFMPWVQSDNSRVGFRLVPAANSTLGPSTVLLVVVFAAGAALLLVRGVVGVVGCVASVWTVSTTMMWMLASDVARLLPARVLPHDDTLQLGVGASLGLLGGLLAAVGAVLVLADQTWPRQRSPMLRERLVVAMVAVAFGLAALGSAWAEFRARDETWRLGLGVVPFIGQALSIALAAGAVLCLVVVVRPRSWMSAALCMVGVGVGLTSALCVASESMLAGALKFTLGRAKALAGADLHVSNGLGPKLAVVAGLGYVAVGVFGLRGSSRTRQRVRSSPNGRSASPQSPVADSDSIPF
jgi:hypothetical protein